VGITRRRGIIRLRLEPVEAQLLTTLLDDLDAALESLPVDDPVRQRLFPAGYRDDAEAAAEFRSLTESSLREAKAQRVGECRADLSSEGGTLQLDSDRTQRWLTVLNDLRLGIGTRLGVQEDEDPVIDPSDPDAHSRAVYHWLTALQDSLVTSALR
jgi:Domain of unknown function (DUF2017)